MERNKRCISYSADACWASTTASAGARQVQVRVQGILRDLSWASLAAVGSLIR